MIWGAGTFFDATYRLRVLGANPSFAAACLVENICLSVTDCFIGSQANRQSQVFQYLSVLASAGFFDHPLGASYRPGSLGFPEKEFLLCLFTVRRQGPFSSTNVNQALGNGMRAAQVAL
jgi:hypothetical protein